MFRSRNVPQTRNRAFILFAAVLTGTLTAQEKLTYSIDHPIVNLPVDNELPTQRVRLEVEGTTLSEFDIQMGSTEPDFWVPYDLSGHQGKTLEIFFEKTLQQEHAKPYLSQEIQNADTVYSESLRPQLHFTSKRGWLNDPNGLVYQDGTYHLYYQHNPYGWNWGNMHWGHAVSKDLIHWEELPIALSPPTYGDMAYSGAAVIDKKNTSGFGSPDNPPLVIAYTSTGRGECIAYSLDGGITFQQYEGNPVIEHQGRDPKIFWYEQGQHWVMVLYDETLKQTSDGYDHHDRALQIYTSSDLKSWQYQSKVSEFFECPELFELAVDNDPNHKLWVIYGGNGQYRLGAFDGKTFTPQTERQLFFKGKFHASQTYNNTPDGRRIQVAWGRGIASPGMPFNQLMLFPCELRLVTTPDGIRMLPRPIEEIELLHGKKHTWTNQVLKTGIPLDTGVQARELHIKAEFELLGDFDFGLVINGYELKYNALDYYLQNAYLRPIDNKITLEVIVDRTSIEIFGNDGRAYIVDHHISDTENLHVKAFSRSPDWSNDSQNLLRKLEIYEMNSIWK
ncbi:glycoside hydrolase family 32 protein [Pelagicoccus sp. SDUM812005]|uniref:glycoside hydrolase family 32 protein n=1 Tax=Pelagicoccus sp. SDUM812005 TaxID=3041257 RepID=UPI00280E9E94|nr:glycoside hydrolase family 32 protein [Pelagicoccus sp. SDUM812005]MDQ8180316.1 glycoside hydrolase family 32 protein [Pelagicoccus sp. SDUM812005]